MPPRKNTKQIFVATGYEPPSKFGTSLPLFKKLNSSALRNLFNLTISYRQDADIVVNAQDFVPRRNSKYTIKMMNFWHSKFINGTSANILITR